MEPAPPPAHRLALRAVLVVVALRSALDLVVAGRYGWHRDELYYAVAGQHLQGGYVEFPPLTALVSALAHALFGWSLVGFRLFTVAAGGATTVVAAAVARELGGSRRAQVLAAVAVGLSPLLVATNDLFQPVSFDQLATMLLLWLVVRLALGRASWPLVGLVVGVGLETKYTLAVPLALLLVGFGVWRRDALAPRGLAVAAAIAAVLMIPNLLWEAGHSWISVHWFLHPPSSGSDESRPLYVGNLLLLSHPVAVPVAVAGVVALWRDRRLRPLAFCVVGTVVAYFALGGKSYYALPVVMFALACGAVPFERWATPRRLRGVGVAWVALLVLALPIGLPVLPLHTAASLHVLDARSDYADEVGWHALARQVEALSSGVDVVVARNYGEAGALEVLGHGLPPVASPHVTFRYWRPRVHGLKALTVGYTAAGAPFCRAFHVVGRIAMPVDNEERGRPIARCTLAAPLAALWPAVVAREPG